MTLEQIGGFLKQQRARFAAQAVPARLDRGGADEGGVDLGRCGITAGADNRGRIMRRCDRRGLARRGTGKGRLGAPMDTFEQLEPLQQRLAHQRIGQVDPRAVPAVCKERGRERNCRIAARRERGEFRHRIADEVDGRNPGIAHAVHKAGVRAVLEQAAHQIGEQLLVPAHRRIDPDRSAPVAFKRVERVIDFLAHAVESLKFKFFTYCFAT